MTRPAETSSHRVDRTTIANSTGRAALGLIPDRLHDDEAASLHVHMRTKHLLGSSGSASHGSAPLGHVACSLSLGAERRGDGRHSQVGEMDPTATSGR